MDRHKKTIAAMIEIYCREKHGRGGQLCDECRELMDYAHARLDNCPFGPDKPPCSECHKHCYKPDLRERTITVMRFAGPRMLKRHPYLAVMHLVEGRRGKKEPPGES